MNGTGAVTVWKDYVPAPATPTPTSAPTPVPTPTPAPTLVPTPSPSSTPASLLVVDEFPEAALVGRPFTLSVSFVPPPVESPSVWAEWAITGKQSTRLRLLDDGRERDARAGDAQYGASLTPTTVGTALVRVWGEVRGREIASWEGRLRVEASRGEATNAIIVRRALPAWVWPSGAVALLGCLGAWRTQRWFSALPRAAGTLRVLQAPSDYTGPGSVDLSVLNRRSVRLGGPGAALPSPAGDSPWATIHALPDGSGMEVIPSDGKPVQVNEHPLTGPRTLSDGDRITAGGLCLRFEHLH